jgi:hypothetical protein
MHRAYQTLVSLLKLLFFFATSFCIAVSRFADVWSEADWQFLILVIKASSKTAELYVCSGWTDLTRSIITIIALPLTPIVILACGWAVRKENKP